MRTVLFLSLVTFPAAPVAAHGGGLNAEGCHNDRKGGTGSHCHRDGSARAAASKRALGIVSRRGGAYANCSATRAAGAAPVRRGDSGYGPHLDRDGDGVGCE